MCLPVRMTASGRMQSFEGIWTPAGGRALEGLGRGFAANHFDVAPVRTNDEGCTPVRARLRRAQQSESGRRRLVAVTFTPPERGR